MSAALLRSSFDEAIALHHRVRDADPGPVLDAAAAIVDALRRGGKLLVFGNGGSAADAQHVAAELVGRFTRERAALAAVALTTDTSVLTSVANDYAFDRVFARQIEALEVARALGMQTIALTGGDGGAVGRVAAIHVNVPSAATPRVQEVQRTLLHVICDIVESAFEQR
jgi:phosphoheptose isomerase